MYDKFTDRAKKVLQLALQEAQHFHHDYIGTEHILLGLVKEGSGVAANLLKNLTIDLRKVRREIEKVVKSGPETAAVKEVPLTPRTKKVLEHAVAEARKLNHDLVGTEHLLLGLLREKEGVAAQVLMNLGLNLKDVRQELLRLLGDTAGASAAAEPEKGEESPAAKPAAKASTLARFTTDWTEAVRQGKLPPVIGREVEKAAALRTFGRRTRNNPLLVGEPGSGKTSIVAGLAEHFARGQVPPHLADCRILALDWPLLVSTSEDFGNCVKRVKAVVRSVREAGNILLFLDDFHLCARAAEAAYSLILALSRGELRCIAATTTAAFHQHIEQDVLLGRCFQPLFIAPASRELTLEILRRLQRSYEVHHQIEIQEEALEAIVDLAERHLGGRALPDKAIDLLDEAGAFVRMKAAPPGPDLKAVETQLTQLAQQKEAAVAAQDFERAAHLRDQAEKLKQERETLVQQWQHQAQQGGGVLEAVMIDDVVKQMAGYTA
jgi:ATP-dependent Clp protease ATP-binding subunit ClpC